MSSFKDYHLKPYLYDALKAISFTETTKVQKNVIPRAIANESLMVESATGSGKTHSFLIPILENLDEDKKEVQAVIISPTRELASQLYNVCLELTKYSNKEILVAKAILSTSFSLFKMA